MEQLLKWFAAVRGRKLRLTEYLELSTGAISQWKRVPEKRVRDVARFTKIPKHVLRPDLFDVQ